MAGHDPAVALIDSMPVPVSRFARAHRCRRLPRPRRVRVRPRGAPDLLRAAAAPARRLAGGDHRGDPGAGERGRAGSSFAADGRPCGRGAWRHGLLEPGPAHAARPPRARPDRAPEVYRSPGRGGGFCGSCRPSIESRPCSGMLAELCPRFAIPGLGLARRLLWPARCFSSLPSTLVLLALCPAVRPAAARLGRAPCDLKPRAGTTPTCWRSRRGRTTARDRRSRRHGPTSPSNDEGACQTTSKYRAAVQCN